MKTYERTVLSLCEEIDHYKAEAEYWKKKYEDELESSIKENNERFESAKKDIGNMIKLAFALEDTPEGDLKMSKENREQFVKDLKP